MSVTFMTNIDKEEITEKLHTFTSEEYFDITEEGIVSLKPEYRGACSLSLVPNLPYAVSDNTCYDYNITDVGSLHELLPEKLVIPNRINGIEVKGFQEGMFCYNFRIKELTLPDTVTTIPLRFCVRAQNLELLKNSKHIEVIEERGFAQTRLKHLSFPNLKQLGGLAFSGNPFLTTIDIGDNITEIPKSAFRFCVSLVKVSGGRNVSKIGEYAFLFTYSLEKLEFLGNGNLKEIEKFAFSDSRFTYEWDSLKNCTIGDGAYPIVDETKDDQGKYYWKYFKKFNGTKEEYLALEETNDDYYSYFPCKNRLGSLFHQADPRWNTESNKYFLDSKNNSTGSQYNYAANGCSISVLAHIYSAIGDINGNVIELNTLKDMEPILREILDNETKVKGEDYTHYTTKHPSQAIPVYLRNLYSSGYSLFTGKLPKRPIAYYSCTATNPISKDTLKKIYKGLANGQYIYLKMNTPSDDSSDHVTTIFGVNDKGELLIADSSLSTSSIGDYGVIPVSVPIQNITSPIVFHMWII